ncbi:hypothetical protein [Morganella phage Mecenats66]|nr:hypothetical protein [Morganella phage Mecenats66]
MKILVRKPEISVKIQKTRLNMKDRAEADYGRLAPVSRRLKSTPVTIDITQYISEGASVNVRKSIREPAGTFSISLPDKPVKNIYHEDGEDKEKVTMSLESLYGLIEPMDLVEIRMWNGVGERPAELPVKMRGFVSTVKRDQAMGSGGVPVRVVNISGHDYGKIWQIYQILYLPAYVSGHALLSNFEFSELFGTGVDNVITSAEFVKRVINNVVNPFIAGFIPDTAINPSSINAGDLVTVPNGVLNNAYQQEEASVYDLLKKYSDSHIWNELFIIDTNKSVECVYRVSPVLTLSAGDENAESALVDAAAPFIVNIPDDDIVSLSASRTDSNVANFFWVNNDRFDLISEISRKLYAIQQNDPSMVVSGLSNSTPQLFGNRPMTGNTNQAGDITRNLNSGLSPEDEAMRSNEFVEWINIRRNGLRRLNEDNSVFETGSLTMRGGAMRPPDAEGNVEFMKPGDHIRIIQGNLKTIAYAVEISDDFNVYNGYTTTINYERGNNFVTRASLGGGVNSPFNTENSLRRDTNNGKETKK